MAAAELGLQRGLIAEADRTAAPAEPAQPPGSASQAIASAAAELGLQRGLIAEAKGTAAPAEPAQPPGSASQAIASAAAELAVAPGPPRPAPRGELEAFGLEVSGCTRCRLAQGRTQVVFGVGNAAADLMFVGEAPGFHEDKQGVPFVGQAGKLLDKLLAEIDLTRADVYVANVLKCRPPGNRDPGPDEIEACESHLFRQIALIRPKLVATLGNFATKLLSGKPLGITRVHGQEQETTLGGSQVVLYPLYHPAAALYTPRMLEVLRADFARIPDLLGRAVAPPPPIPMPTLAPAPEPVAVQLGLF